MQAWLQGMGLGGVGMGGMMGRYDQSFICYGAVFMPNATDEKTTEIDYGGKILLPTSALDMLLRMNIQYPMLFKITNTAIQRVTHAGVLEFSAPEGQAIIPQWMMAQLGLQDGQRVRIESATLPKATFAKLKPMSLEFLNITNPKAVLEVELRKYACLTKGDKIPTSYAGQTLEFLVVDVKPANSVCIIECDVNLDFDAPEGYVDNYQPKAAATAAAAIGGSSVASVGASVVKPPAPLAFHGAGQSLGSATGGSNTLAAGSGGMGRTMSGSSGFGGAGRRLDGKSGKSASVSVNSTAEIAADLPAVTPVVVNEDYKAGRLSFVRYDYKRLDVLEKELREKEAAGGTKSSKMFQGGSRTLRGAR